MRKPKRKPKRIKSLHPKPIPIAHPESSRQALRRFGKKLVSFVAVLGAIVGLILFGDWIRDQYDKTNPIVWPQGASGTSKALPFVVQNISPYFWMRQLILVCYQDSVTLESSNGGHFILARGNLSPGIQTKPTDLAPNSPIPFECDPSETTRYPSANGMPQRIVAAKMRVKATYETRFLFISWKRKYDSPDFPCRLRPTGFQCFNNEFAVLDDDAFPPTEPERPVTAK